MLHIVEWMNALSRVVKKGIYYVLITCDQITNRETRHTFCFRSEQHIRGYVNVVCVNLPLLKKQCCQNQCMISKNMVQLSQVSAVDSVCMDM